MTLRRKRREVQEEHILHRGDESNEITGVYVGHYDWSFMHHRFFKMNQFQVIDTIKKAVGIAKCDCGCGRTMVLPRRKMVHFTYLGWKPIFAECYPRVRRRYRGKVRRELYGEFGVLIVRRRGSMYVSR